MFDKYSPIAPGHRLDKLFPPIVYGRIYYVFCIGLGLIIIFGILFALIYTLPYQTLKKYPVSRSIALRNVKRGALKRIEKIEKKLIAGNMTLHAAYDQLDRTVRTFLYIETGLPVYSMHKTAITNSILAPYLMIISVTDTGRYSYESDPQFMRNSRYLKDLVEDWGL